MTKEKIKEMYENLCDYLEILGVLVRDYGCDVIIFKNFTFYFFQMDWEAIKRFDLVSMSYLDKQPYKQEIIEVFNLAKEFASLITK